VEFTDKLFDLKGAFVHFENVRVAILANFPLHVIPSLSKGVPPAGHYATWLPPLAEATSSNDGIERTWITLSEDITERKEVTFWNQTFIVLPSRKKGRASSFYREDRAAIAQTLRRINPDLVHGWGTEDIYALAAVTSGYPSIVSMQGILTHYIFHARTDLRTCFQALLELFVFYKGKTFVGESPWATSVLKRRMPRKEIIRIEYAVHPDFFNAQWLPDPRRPIALFAGSLVPRKGFQDVLKAFRSPLLKERTLWVAGSGPLEKKIDGMPNVIQLGRIDRPRLIEAMSKAWCLVIPSRGDTGPMIVKEARVMGLPIVTTLEGGQSNYVEEGRNGFFVEPGDISLLTDRLHRLLSDYEFCRQRGKDGWEQDRALFRPDLMAEKFRNLYRELHRRRSSTMLTSK